MHFHSRRLFAYFLHEFHGFEERWGGLNHGWVSNKKHPPMKGPHSSIYPRAKTHDHGSTDVFGN